MFAYLFFSCYSLINLFRLKCRINLRNLLFNLTILDINRISFLLHIQPNNANITFISAKIMHKKKISLFFYTYFFFPGISCNSRYSTNISSLTLTLINCFFAQPFHSNSTVQQQPNYQLSRLPEIILLFFHISFYHLFS